MAFDPDAYLKQKSTQNKSTGFDPDAYLESKRPKKSITESAVRGAAQGASLGFADEIVGGAKSLWDDMTAPFSEDDGRAKAKYDQFGRVSNADELNESMTYQKHRDSYREGDRLAKEDNPGAYTAGVLGGGLATAAMPLGASASIAQAARTGARFGAISGLGESEARNAAGLIEDSAFGAGLGAAGGAAGKALQRGIESVRSGAKSASQAASQTLSKEAGSIPVENPDVLKEVTKSAQGRIKNYWKPEIDPSWDEFADIARKNGIDPNILPEAVKFGPDSSVSRATRNIAEGRYGEETLKRFNRALDEVRGAYDNKITRYSQGAPVDEVTAGNVLRNAYDEGVTKFFDQMDMTHNSIINQVPDFRLNEASTQKIASALNGVEKFAIGRTMRGVTQTQRGQGQQLLNAVEAIRAGNGSYKQTVEALRDIGEAAFQSKNSLADVPVDVQKMRKLYNDINESLLGTVRSELGDDIANSLVSNNKAMSEFFGDQSLISQVMGNKAIAPEKAFQSLILNGDTKKIEALKKILPPEKWEYLKGAVLENITKRDPEGGFGFKQLYSSMRNKKNTLSAIFTPDELAESAGLVRLGDRFGNPVLSSSGTGASISFNDLTKGVANLTTDAVAIRNANRAAERTIQAPAAKVTREAPQALKDAASRAAGVFAAPATSERGQERWITTGARKLQEAGISQDQLEQLRSTKAGRNLLIDASDASPGSRRLDSVLKRIREMKGGQ